MLNESVGSNDEIQIRFPEGHMFFPLDVITTACVKKQKNGEKQRHSTFKGKRAIFPVNSKAVFFLIYNFVNKTHHVLTTQSSHSFNTL